MLIAIISWICLIDKTHMCQCPHPSVCSASGLSPKTVETGSFGNLQRYSVRNCLISLNSVQCLNAQLPSLLTLLSEDMKPLLNQAMITLKSVDYNCIVASGLKPSTPRNIVRHVKARTQSSIKKPFRSRSFMTYWDHSETMMNNLY